MTYNIDEYSRVETLCEGTPENYLVGLTEVTVRRILQTDNPFDALALYSFYCYVAKWQCNNSVWAVASYCMNHLKIGKDRFHSAKQTLLDLELIEDDPRYDHEKGRMDKWYVRVRHLSGATLRKSYSTEIPQGRETAYSNQRHKIELPESNKKKPSTIKYPTKAEADAAANGADAQVGKADALSSRPPNSVNTRTPFRAPKSPPIDPEKFSEFRNRANRLLGRRDATNWSAGEIKAAKANLETCEEDWKLLEKYYANRGKDGFYTRRSMLTLLNNWAGEIDKSRAHYEKESENEYRCDDFKL
jgi:hypothetical protein